ncbi:MAG TPA: SPOR domain-containing protein [Stellaceae bacterium]|nr:SPOR domain-containing protein [Stellaceae bacterium]
MSTSSTRPSNTASAVYTAIALVFFFGLGMAGGAAYKLFIAQDYSDQQAAGEGVPPAPVQTADATPGHTAAAPNFAEPLAHLTPSAPPALAPPPAPTSLPPNILIKPTAPADIAPPAADTAAFTPPAASLAPSEPVAPAPEPYAQVAPAAPSPPQDAAAAAPAPPPAPRAVAHHAAPPPRKPRVVAKAKPLAPKEPAVALHQPPTAPMDESGPFRVQFGAFANEENARRVQWAVEATGLKVEVDHAPGGTSGQLLYYLRSPLFPDYASALSAAETVQHRVQHFVNAIPIDYAILGDHSGDHGTDHAGVEQQADAR